MNGGYTPPGGGSGDMTKAVYDPQNVSKISGDTTGTGTGGVLSMEGGLNAAADAGSVTTDGDPAGSSPGGLIDTHGAAGGAGGVILTYSSATAPGGVIQTFAGAAQGGNLYMEGGTASGGSIDTHDGGGSINTRGQGVIELGSAGSRTRLLGASVSDVDVFFPVAGGTLVASNNYTITQAEANESITPIADGPNVLPGTLSNGSITFAKGICTAYTAPSFI